jgi:hypothetical protein
MVGAALDRCSLLSLRVTETPSGDDAEEEVPKDMFEYI